MPNNSLVCAVGAKASHNLIPFGDHISWVVLSVAGASAYMDGVDYSQEKFRGELKAMVEYIKRAAQEGQH